MNEGLEIKYSSEFNCMYIMYIKNEKTRYADTGK